MSRVVVLVVGSLLATSCAKDPDVAKRAYLESGNAYFARGKYAEAIVQYRNAVQKDPRFGEARYKLAEAYVRLADAAGAYREYIRAADLMPADVASQLKAGQMLLLARQFEDAKARADRVLTHDPKNLQGQILRGAALAGLGDFDSAIAQVEEAIELDPEKSGTYDNLGALRLAKGDSDAAESAFKKAVQIDGKSVPARLALAAFYLSTRRPVEAEDALTHILRLDAANPTANRALASLYLGTNRAADAEPYLKTFVEAAKTAAARLALADYYTLMNRASEAVPILEAVGAEDPQTFAGAQTRLAAIAYTTKQTTDAHKRLSDLLAKQPKHSPARLLNARFLLAERQLDGALEQAKAATEADPTSAQAQFILGKVFAATGQFSEAAKAFGEVLNLNPRAVAAQTELARVQLADRHVEASIDSARQVLRGQPENPDARLLLARGLVASGELKPAELELKTLLAKYPNVASVHSQVGIVSLANGDHAAARRSFERALALDGRSFEALSGLVGLDLAAKNNGVARARVEGQLTQSPGDVRLLLLAATTYVSTGDPGRAEQALQRVGEIEPANIQAHAMLGHLFLFQQKPDQARAEFETVARLRPQSSDAFAAQTMVALIFERQRRPDEARRQYEQILGTSPRSIVAANNLAWQYIQRGDNVDVALGLAQTAAQQMPDQPQINDTLGWIYYKKDLPAQAIAALTRSVEKDPANPIYHYHLGMAYRKSGDLARAKRSLERALTLDSEFDGSSDARRVLASITG